MKIAWAEWRGPINGRTPGGMEHPILGTVAHIMGATASASDNWFHAPGSGDPGKGAGAHFGICNGQSVSTHPGWVDGHLLQWADTDDRAWHAGGANRRFVGVETEGSGGPFTEAQVQTFARLYRELESVEHFGFALAKQAGDKGMNWHGLGGSAWGGHPYCPGKDRIAQLPRILELAQDPQPPEADMDTTQDQRLKDVHALLIDLKDGKGPLADKIRAIVADEVKKLPAGGAAPAYKGTVDLKPA